MSASVGTGIGTLTSVSLRRMVQRQHGITLYGAMWLGLVTDSVDHVRAVV